MKTLKRWDIVGLIVLLLISGLGWIFARSSPHHPSPISPPKHPPKGEKQNLINGFSANSNSQRQIARYLPLLKNNPFLPKVRGRGTVSPLSPNPPGPLPPLDPAHLELRKNIISSYKNWVYVGYAETEEGPIALLEHQKTKQGRFLFLGGELEGAYVSLLSSSVLGLTDNTGKKYILPLNQPGLSPSSSKEGDAKKEKSPAGSPPGGEGPSLAPRNIAAPNPALPMNPSSPQPTRFNQDEVKKQEIKKVQDFSQPLSVKIEKQ